MIATDPNGDLYGASRMFVESVDGFLDDGWRVVCCIPSDAPLNDAIRSRGGEVRDVPSPTLRKTYLDPVGLLRLAWSTLRAIPAGIRVLREVRPDVLYVNTVIQPLWIVLAWCMRIPVICHVHEAEASAAMPIRKAIAAPLLLAKRLIINSEFSRRVLVESLGTLRGRCEVVPNGVVGPPTVRAARESLDGPVKLLYVGRLSERKGVGDAVEAIGVLRSRGIDAELGIVGSVYPGYEDVEVGLRNQVAELDLRDRVVLHGPRPEIWTALENCDVLVVPSRIDEPFGNTAVEGLLGARPVVVTRTGGLVEATGGAASALGVAPSAPEEIAGAVARIVADWQDFRERAQRDAATMAERHSPGRYRTRVVELTKSLIR